MAPHGSEGGIYKRLYDNSATWRQRLKLARCVWKYESVWLLNKDQMILDWLCAAISTKKRVSPQDVSALWQTLHEVLQTRKCQHTAPGGQTLVVRGAIFQILLKELSSMTTSDAVGHLDDIIASCCVSLLSSNHLSSAISAKFEFMLQFVTCSAEVCCRMLTRGHHVSATFCRLMHIVLDKYETTQRQKTNIQQVVQQVASKLLLPTMQLSWLTRNFDADDDGLKKGTQRLCNAVFTALFDSTLASHYAMFLKLSLNETEAKTSQSSLPKFIECIFAIFQTALRQKKDDRDVTLHFLPSFYRSFIQCHSNQKSNLGLQLFQYLAKLLGVFTETDDVCTVLPSVVLLLDVFLEGDVCDVADSEKNVTLAWFREVIDWLLVAHVERSASWFCCLHRLLRLSHRIQQPRITDVLFISCTTQALTPEAALCRDKFLCELVAVYVRLRQIPSLILSLLETAHMAIDSSSVEWPKHLMVKLSEAITNLPPATSVQIWENFLEKFVQHNRTTAAYQLFCHILRHLSLVDYAVTPQIATRVRHCMKQTLDLVIRPLLSFNEFSLHLAANLQLAHCWSNMRILLARYANWPADGTCGDDALGFAHPYLSTADLCKLEEMADDRCDKPVSYMLLRIRLQCLREIITFRNYQTEQPPPPPQESLCNIVTKLLQAIPAPADEQCQQSWDGQVTSITVVNYPIAIWQMLCCHSNILLPICSDEELLKFADFFLWTLRSAKTQCSSNDVVSLQTTSIAMATSDSFQEMARLHPTLLTSAIRKSSQAIASQSSKKAEECLMTSFLSKLAASDVDWNQVHASGSQLPVDCEGERILTEICSCLDELFATGDAQLLSLPDDVDSEAAVMEYLKSLLWLPLEWLPPTDRLRCTLSLLALLVCFGLRHPRLGSSICRCLSLVMTGDGVLSRLHVGHLASWLLSALSEIRMQDTILRRSVHLFLEVILKVTCRSATLLDQLGAFVTQLVEQMEKASVTGTEAEAMDCDDDVDHSVHLAPSCSSPSSLQCLVIVLSCFDKVLSASNSRSRSDAHPLLVHHYTCLVNCLLGYMSRFSDSVSCPSSAVLSSGLLRGVSFGLEGADETRTKRMVQMAAPICLHWLQKLTTSNDVAPWCCLFITTIVHKDIVDGLPPNFLHECFSLLLASLARFPMLPAPPVGDNEHHTKQRHRTFNFLEETVADIDNDDVTELQRSEVEKTLVAIMSVVDVPTFVKVIDGILNSLNVVMLSSCPSQLVASVALWRLLMKVELSQEALGILSDNTANLVQRLQVILLECCHSNEAKQPVIVVAILDTLTDMLAEGVGFISPQNAMRMLTCCHLTPICSGDSLADFARLYNALYRTLNELLVQQSQVVFECVAPFVGVARKLLKVMIHRGRQTDEPCVDTDEDTLVACARLIERLFSLVATHKVEFGKVACYLVADYVTEVQQVTLIPAVKKCILPGIYKLLDLCDSHSISLLQAVLPVGTRDIFSAIYQDYTHYYKFTGHV